MGTPVYKIWFEPARGGEGYYVPGFLFATKREAESTCDIYRHADNPAWRGKFSVVELVDGKPSG